MELSDIRRWLAPSLALSLLYLVTTTAHFPGRWAVKSGSVAMLAVAARRYPLLAAGLAFGALGDALLDLSSSYFTAGLVAFLIGHVFYTAFFIRSGRRRVVAPALALILYSAVFLWWLWPGLGTMRIPVAVYVAAIAAMAIASCRFSWWVALGAMLFLLSDSILAANRFKTAVPGRDYLVWLTYYAGQFLIAWASISALQRIDESRNRVGASLGMNA